MSGRQIAGGRAPRKRPLEDYVRIACAIDPQDPPVRPRRVAITPRAAIAGGILIIALALLLAIRSVLVSADTTARAPALAAGATGSPGAAGAARPTIVPSGLVTAGGGTAGPVGSGAADGAVVHVTGAVTSPGVVTLPAGARVADALNAAGGAAPDADMEQLNLARVVVDGEQIRVPRQGEELPPAAPGPTGPSAAGAGAGRDSGGSGRVDINTADATALEALPGVGPALAKRIVDYRAEHGPFATVDSLIDVPGIGQAKLEALRGSATV
ncbi:ComEA family DNA-binding protein [Actinomyces timonensis]|uniref:ComEA family DNA-binding protein n=1 Tax=Actinomyces timonensis TaxID=1288391 RepID=A0AAU8MZT6_9ACTO